MRIGKERQAPLEQAPVDHNEGVPSGYVRAPLMDGFVPLICEGCGASVSWPTGVPVHSAWHQRLWERLGIS